MLDKKEIDFLIKNRHGYQMLCADRSCGECIIRRARKDKKISKSCVEYAEMIIIEEIDKGNITIFDLL